MTVRLEDLPGEGCPACGTELSPARHVNAIYCSPECGVRACHARVGALRAAARRGLTCPECAAVFDAPRTLWQVYCSPACRRRAARRRWEAKPSGKASRARTRARQSAERIRSAAAARRGLTCPECAAAFDASTLKQVYCSPRCQQRSAERRRPPRRG